MNWTHRATSEKCELCRHGYEKEKQWSGFYGYAHAFVIAWCRACGRTERVNRV